MRLNAANLSRVLLLLLALQWVTACSPRLNWRQLNVAQDSAQVLFPGKPSTQTRKLLLAGMQRDFSLTAVKVDQAMFAVGWADIANTQDASAVALALQQAITKTLGADAATTAPVKKEPTAAGQTTEVKARGQLQGQPARLHAKFIERPNKVIEIIALGPESDLTEQDAETFVGSVKFGQ